MYGYIISPQYSQTAEMLTVNFRMEPSLTFPHPPQSQGKGYKLARASLVKKGYIKAVSLSEVTAIPSSSDSSQVKYYQLVKKYERLGPGGEVKKEEEEEEEEEGEAGEGVFVLACSGRVRRSDLWSSEVEKAQLLNIYTYPVQLLLHQRPHIPLHNPLLSMEYQVWNIKYGISSME